MSLRGCYMGKILSSYLAFPAKPNKSSFVPKIFRYQFNKEKK